MNEPILKLVTMTGCSEKQALNFIGPICQPLITPIGAYDMQRLLKFRVDALNDLLDFISGHSGE